MTVAKYCVAPGIKWAVEIDGIVLMDEKAGKTCFLSYPQAALWDLISRGVFFEKTLSMLSAIASLKPEDAEAFIRKTLDDWVTSGYLNVRAEHG